MAETKPIAAGTERAYYGLKDANGVFIGSGTTAPAAGNQDGSALARIDGFRSADTSVPELDRVPAEGDDTTLVEFLFESSALPGGNIEVAVDDLDFQAKALGMSVVTLGDTSLLGMGGPKNPNRADMVLVLQQQAKSWTAGSKGTSRFRGVIANAVTVHPLGDNMSIRAVSYPRLQLTMNKSDLYPWGATMSTGTEGVEETGYHKFAATNPLMLQRWTGDGAETVFNLAHVPNAANANNVRVWLDGIPRTYTTDFTASVAAQTLTFVVAPGNNQPIVAMYIFDPTA